MHKILLLFIILCILPPQQESFIKKKMSILIEFFSPDVRVNLSSCADQNGSETQLFGNYRTLKKHKKNYLKMTLSSKKKAYRKTVFT